MGPVEYRSYPPKKDSGDKPSGTTFAVWEAIDRVLQKLNALEKRVEEIEKELKELKEVK
jgi:hypothetical protein